MSNTIEPIPGYRILEKIGEGAFARVYLAEQVSLRRNVALKIMSPVLARNVEYCERFLREGRTLAQLSNHPDIVTIYDIGQAGEFYYMAMEYLGGSDLKQRIVKNVGFDGDSIRVIQSIASALAFAHRAGVVHRDIKPANVLFNKNGDAVLSDFGISKSLEQPDATLTVVGTQMGTPSYMSPEQCRGDVNIDGKSDIYSLGAMFYEMLCGRKPYEKNNFPAIVNAHLYDPAPQLPAEQVKYQPLINSMMAKDVSDRYPHAEKFLEDLQQIRNPTATQQGNRTGIVGKLAAVVIVITACVALSSIYWFRDTNEPLDPEAIPGPGLSEEDHDKVQRLLDAGQLHEIVGRYIAPPGSNALEAYERVLEIDPTNAFAIANAARLRKKYGN